MKQGQCRLGFALEGISEDSGSVDIQSRAEFQLAKDIEKKGEVGWGQIEKV